jgi:plastocyanin
MNKKNLSSLFLSLILSLALLGQSPTAFAADAKILFDIDCNTLNKDVLVGFQSDPADPSNGEEIIAFEFTVNLEPLSGTVLADLANAKFQANNSYNNLIVAQNTSNEVGTVRQLKIAGGFTQQTGLNNVNDLLSITGVSQKSYKISVEDGKLFPKSGGDDIYTDSAPKQSFSADPSSCQSGQSGTQSGSQAQTGQENVVIENFAFTPSEITIEVGETIVWTNSDSTDHTVTSIGAGGLESGTLAPGESFQNTFTEAGTYEYKCSIHPQMTARVIVTAAATTTTTGTSGASTGTSTNPGTTAASTAITLTSDTSNANPGDEVTVTATISNLSGSIDWSQTEGSRIQPNISNDAVSDTETKSTLTFTMPTPATNVTLRLKVEDETETITIVGADNVTTSAASTDTSGTDQTATDTNAASSDTTSLQERLEQRRAEQEAAANPTAATSDPTGTLNGAAGAGLARSGPEHTLALLVLSALLALGYTKKKASSLA